jgi:ABC-type transport system involved in multi-copper enzyme maturation permease subunit
MNLVNAIRSEAAKLVTTRLWWILLLVLVGYVLFTAGLIAGLFGALGDQLADSGQPALPAELLTPIVYSVATAVGYVFPLILGALSVTNEFRHQTLTPTFLATPGRGTVLVAKVVVLAVAGAVFGLAGAAASIGIGAPLLELSGNSASLDSPDTWWLAARVVLAMALWAVVGVGVGALVPNQVASIVIVLAFTQFLEPILRFGTSILEWTAQVGRFLPGAASDALVGASIYTTIAPSGSSVAPLEWWQGGLVLVAYAVVAGVAGYFTSWRKDVT